MQVFTIGSKVKAVAGRFTGLTGTVRDHTRTDRDFAHIVNLDSPTTESGAYQEFLPAELELV